MISRWQFATRWMLRHVLISTLIALISALIVFKWWYPAPYPEILGVGGIFVLLLIVDVVCGPLMTLILANPKKSKREMALDLGLIGIIQAIALVYGLHAVWVGRPAVLAFEKDRLIVLSANEIEIAEFPLAPPGLQALPFAGLLQVGTRKPKDNKEFLQSFDLSLAGVSPGMRPAWWEPMEVHTSQMRERARPLADLIARRPEKAGVLNAAATGTGYPLDSLKFLPLTSSKTRDWVALLNPSMKIVGYAEVDGFE